MKMDLMEMVMVGVILTMLIHMEEEEEEEDMEVECLAWAAMVVDKEAMGMAMVEERSPLLRKNWNLWKN